MSKFTDNSLTTFSTPVIQKIIDEAIELGWYTIEENFEQQKTGRYQLLPPISMSGSVKIMLDTAAVIQHKGKILIVPEAVGDFNIRKHGINQ